MKSVIYLDELLLTNFVLAALFLTAAGLLCATVCTGVRLCTGAALAAVSALVLLAPELPGAVAVGYKIFTGCAVVAAAYGLPGRGRFARLCAWYALLNLLLCGAVVLPSVQSRNLSVSLPLSPGRLLASCAGVYAVLRALLYCFGRSGAPSVPATLEVAGVQLPVQAFHDTGFALQEPLSGKAVVLVLHDLCLAMQCADRIAVLSDGQILQSGTPEEVYVSGVLDQVMGIRLCRMETGDGWRYYYRPL